MKETINPVHQIRYNHAKNGCDECLIWVKNELSNKEFKEWKELL